MKLKKTQFLIPGDYTGVTGGQLLKLNKHPWIDVSGVWFITLISPGPMPWPWTMTLKPSTGWMLT